jgi:predicted glutamine amidotransferase
MLAALEGVPGRAVADSFVRMARGENTLNERNTSLGLVRHGDGWGAVLVENGKQSRFRSAKACWNDPDYAQISSTHVRLLHARLASQGGHGETHAHPFLEQIRGEPWYFCHNGTIRDEPGDGTGATDSERFFHRLAVLLDLGLDPIHAFESAASIVRDVTALNAFLLGPSGLWAFCVWSDPGYRAYYTLSWTRTREGFLVASEPLDGVSDCWGPMENGTALWASERSPIPRTSRLRLPDALMPSGE